MECILVQDGMVKLGVRPLSCVILNHIPTYIITKNLSFVIDLYDETVATFVCSCEMKKIIQIHEIAEIDLNRMTPINSIKINEMFRVLGIFSLERHPSIINPRSS